MKSHTASAAGEARVLLGLAVQPLVTAALGIALFPIVEVTGRSLYHGRPADPIDAAISFGLGMGITGLLVTVFGAFPTLMWLVNRGPVTRRQALISGAVLGNLPGALIVSGLALSRVNEGIVPTLNDMTYGPVGALRTIAFGTVIGTVSAAVFWLMAGHRLASDYFAGESPR
ncbi:MAG TPA: hypothetical protein VKB50_09360 [Vicinamibacterales bacterium]|nr:hypothetical protein [Vicinamibacterales bacterium]